MTRRRDEVEQSIPARFGQVARRFPDGIAIAGGAWEPTFAELDASANGIARTLLERVGEAEGRVALLFRHDAPLFAAALAILKAGKTAVALTPSDPAAHLVRIRADLGPELVLVDRANRDLARRAGFPEAETMVVAERPEASAAAPPPGDPGPGDLAFLIQTSGSTGVPKTVMQTHRNVLHNVARHTAGLGITERDRVLLCASLSSGQGLGTTWSTLLNGATLCPFPIQERGLAGLRTWLAANRVTVFVAAASVFRGFVGSLHGERIDGIRLVRLASEPALRADFDAFRRHFPADSLLASTFSSSETGNLTRCVLRADAEVADGRLPVGTPAEDIDVRLVGEGGREAAPGEIGEIVVRSRYLSPGYWRNEALTAERFGSVARGDALREFRTGDLGRLEDGMLTIVGRNDSQVKVRGGRVELAEVEAVLLARPEVSAAAVVPRTTPHGDTALTAYIVAPPGRPDAGALRSELRSVLPDRAVPTELVFAEALPLGPTGKLDRGRLERGETRVPQSAPAVWLTETERLVAEAWSEAFELADIGREDGFLELGGDSLTAAVIAAGVHDRLGVEIDLNSFDDRLTVPRMASMVEAVDANGANADAMPLRPAPSGEAPPASLMQERIWQLSTPGRADGYTVAIPEDIAGPLDVGALRQAVDWIVRRHEVLRTTLEERGGQLRQVVHPPAQVDVPLLDLRDERDPKRRADELLADEAAVPFDLERGPLLRLRLLRLADEQHRLLRINHHIISDGWSWKVFFDELGPLYEAFADGRPPPLGEALPLQYRDFASWERRRMSPDSPRYRAELDWWRDLAEKPAAIALPFARAEAAGDVTPSDGVIWWGLPAEVGAALDRVGGAAGATFYMTRLAVMAAQAALDTRCDDVVLGTYVTHRNRAELQALFGPLFNLTVLRLEFSGDPTLREWVARVRSAVIETSERSQVPYEQLWQELGAEGVTPPALQAMVEVFDEPPLRRIGEITLAPRRVKLPAVAAGFCSFTVDRHREAERCLAAFDPRAYEPAGVRAFIDRYRRLAAAGAADPDRPLRSFRHIS